MPYDGGCRSRPGSVDLLVTTYGKDERRSSWAPTHNLSNSSLLPAAHCQVPHEQPADNAFRFFVLRRLRECCSLVDTVFPPPPPRSTTAVTTGTWYSCSSRLTFSPRRSGRCCSAGSPCDFDVYYSGGRGRRVYRTDFRTGESTLVCMTNSEVLDMELELGKRLQAVCRTAVLLVCVLFSSHGCITMHELIRTCFFSIFATPLSPHLMVPPYTSTVSYTCFAVYPRRTNAK